jgi:hypothetical protein
MHIMDALLLLTYFGGMALLGGLAYILLPERLRVYSVISIPVISVLVFGKYGRMIFAHLLALTIDLEAWYDVRDIGVSRQRRRWRWRGSV